MKSSLLTGLLDLWAADSIDEVKCRDGMQSVNKEQKHHFFAVLSVEAARPI